MVRLRLLIPASLVVVMTSTAQARRQTPPVGATSQDLDVLTQLWQQLHSPLELSAADLATLSTQVAQIGNPHLRHIAHQDLTTLTCVLAPELGCEPLLDSWKTQAPKRDLPRRIALEIGEARRQQNTAALLSLWQQVEGDAKLRSRLFPLGAEMAQYFDQNSRPETARAVREKLLEEFPLHPGARDAFYHLLHQARGGVEGVFSQEALRNMSRNASASEFSADFILQQMLAATAGKAPGERRQSLAKLTAWRLYPQAFAFGKELEPELLAPDSCPEHRLSFLETMGLISNRLHRYHEAASYISQALKEPTATQAQRLNFLEMLGDSLRYRGLYRRASHVYDFVTKIRPSPLLRWHQFWNAYVSQDSSRLAAYHSAPTHALPLRDPALPEARLYWKARILAHHGALDASREALRQLVNAHRDSIYSYFALELLGSRAGDSAVTLSFDPPTRAILGNHPARSGSLSAAQWRELLPTGPPGELIAAALLLAQIGRWRDGATLLREIDGSRLRTFDLITLAAVANQLDAGDVAYAAGRRVMRAAHPKPLSMAQVLASLRAEPTLWRWYYPRPHNTLVSHLARKYQLDPLLVFAIGRNESHYRDDALSRVGARGMMQIMPYTAEQIRRQMDLAPFDPGQSWEPELNLRLGTWYLGALMRAFGQVETLAIAAYNAGPEAVYAWLNRCKGCSGDEFIETISYSETRRYVKRVSRDLARYRAIYPNEKQKPMVQHLPAIRRDQSIF